MAGADRDYHAHMAAGAPRFGEVVDFPDHCPERSFPLGGREMLIGRRSRSRGIEPDVDLTGPPVDPGISHVHALLVANPGVGWSVVDLDSANGTRLNHEYRPIQANKPVPLRPVRGLTALSVWSPVAWRERPGVACRFGR